MIDCIVSIQYTIYPQHARVYMLLGPSSTGPFECLTLTSWEEPGGEATNNNNVLDKHLPINGY